MSRRSERESERQSADREREREVIVEVNLIDHEQLIADSANR
jgi:hypothetical protein